jgi:hypothetical protein
MSPDEKSPKSPLSDDDELEKKDNSLSSSSASTNLSYETPEPNLNDSNQQEMSAFFSKHQHQIGRINFLGIISLCLLRLSIAITFLGYFLIPQHYNYSIAMYFSSFNDIPQLIIPLVLIGLIIASFFYLLHYKNNTTVADKRPHKQKTSCEKFSNFCLISGIITTMLMQSFLIPQLFITSIAQWPTPLLLSLSCSLFFMYYLCGKTHCCSKTINIILFFIGVFSGVLLLLETFNTIPSFVSHSFWTDKLLPITLLISITSCSILTLEPLFKLNCHKKQRTKANDNRNTQAIKSYTNVRESNIDDAIQPQHGTQRSKSVSLYEEENDAIQFIQ